MSRLIVQLRSVFCTAQPQVQAFGDAEVAATVLLVEAASMDEKFDASERAVIEKIIAERFSLDKDEARELIAAAEQQVQKADGVYPCPSSVITRMPLDQRIRIVEMLWEIAYADGALDKKEELLVRRVAELIYISEQDRTALRKRVLEKLGRT